MNPPFHPGILQMTVAELRKALKAKGLTSTGVKQDLIDRLQLAVATEETDPNNDNDLLDDADELLGDDDDHVVDSPKKAEAEVKAAPPAAAAAKKVAIKRVTAVDNVGEKPSTEAEPASTDASSPPAAVKKMTDAERAAARAARFGATLDVASDVKKQSRAERFGLKNAAKIGGAPTVDLDTLKKRAERFGQSSSDVIKKAEMDEKIRKRQERFGQVEPEKKKPKKSEILSAIELNKTLKSPPKVEDEKLLKRAEKFGIAPKQAA